MNEELRKLLNQINQKKAEVKNLANENKLVEAKAAKKELIDLQAKFDAIYDLEEDHSENIKSKIMNGDFININGSSKSKDKQILNRADKLVNTISVSEDDKGLNLGNYIKGAITGDWNNSNKELDRFKALTTGTGKIIIPTVLSAEIIDLARNKSVLFGGGVPMVKMESNNMTIGKIKSDPQFAFKEEGAKITPSEMTFEGVELKSKTAYGVMKVTLEVLHSAQNLDSLLRETMAQAIADMIDKACLFGNGTVEPKGILKNTDINTVVATNIRYTDYVKGVGAIRRNNGEPTTMVINARIDESLNSLCDTNGNPLGVPRVIEALDTIISNQMPSDTGADQTESIGMIFDPLACLIGMQVPIGLEVDRSNGFEDGTVMLRIYSMLDIAVVKPKNITKITGQKEITV